MDIACVVRNIINGDGSATVSDYGAHLIGWAPAGQAPVLWQPKTLAFSPGIALRTGIPIIFPWFNGGYDHGTMAAKRPKHGFARSSFWHVDGVSLTDRHIRYTLDSDEFDGATVAQIISGPGSRFRAAYDIEVDERLSATLTVTNTGERPLEYEAALHTYLRVGDVAEARVLGLAGTRYLDATRPGFPECDQANDALAFDGTMVDRIYSSDTPLRLRDDALDRTIVIGKSGSPQTVVWNPGERAGNAIADLSDGEWRDFVCVEAAAVRDHAARVEPGESHSLGQSISVE